VYSDNWLMVEVVVLVCLLLVNVYFVSWDDELRHAELGDKARRLIARLDSECQSLSFTNSLMSLSLIFTLLNIGHFQTAAIP